RAAAGKLEDKDDTVVPLMLLNSPRDPQFKPREEMWKFRNLLTRHVIGKLDDDTIESAILSSKPTVRAQAIVLISESHSQKFLRQLANRATHDDSPYVRIHLASALQ